MDAAKEQKQQHAICIAYPSQGHINPLLKLAKLLHSQGFYITFVHTKPNYNRILESRGPEALAGLPTFRFEAISDVDELPKTKDANATKDLLSLCVPTEFRTLGPFKELIKRLNESSDVPQVSCIVADVAMFFTLDVAEELGIPIVLQFTASPCGFLAYAQFPKLVELGITPFKDEKFLTNGDLDVVLDWVPCMKGIRVKDMPSFIRTTDPNHAMLNRIQKKEIPSTKRASALIFNSFDALDTDILKELSTDYPPIYTLGPLQLLLDIIEAKNAETKSINPSLLKEDSHCLKWLDSFSPNSVVYVNFGTIAIMTNDQLLEFAWGLANSNQPFLWITRPDLVTGGTAVLPPEFLEKTKGRGLIASWCNQEQVLAHPAIGGFLMHGGWNSTLESISNGVPVLCWPFVAEQQTNCWFCCNKWGTGMEIDSNVKRSVVERQIRELIQGEKGKEMKRKAMEWKRRLRNNSFNGTLDMGDNISQQLQLVDFENNKISSVTLGSKYTNTLILIGNPVCITPLSSTDYCQIQQQTKKPYSTSLANCGSKQCPEDEKLSPQSCECAYPYEGTMYFRGPSFRELSDTNIFHQLEMSLWVKLGLTPGSVSLKNPFFNVDDYLQIHLEVFPSGKKYFNRSEVMRIGFDLSNQTFKPPPVFGPYYFIASPYLFSVTDGRTTLSLGLIVGITTICSVLVVLVVGVSIYAIRQKTRAERAIGLSRPFVSWGSSGKDSGSAPQLKGARWFPYDELKKCTNSFSQRNEIGSGGYGKVYKGVLSDGQLVAIKRAQQGSKQGGLEFKTEIELLSRVHHKNLVGLLGFCFEQGEQILVYEYMANGSLRENLYGRSGIHLDWKRRLRIALGSARGLTYLHELANPPIIHRDIKSSNILLDENLTAKVADFGLCKLVSDSSKGHVSTQVKGTLGYLDPEYYLTQQLTEKSDVYSFGVVMLELITATQPIEKGKYIVREVRTTIDKNEEEFCGLKVFIDPTIKNTLSNLIGFRRFVELAMKCVEEAASDRPTMSEVVKEIESILQNDGINTGSTSTSSSMTDFGANKGAMKHPYDGMTKKEISDGGAFDYSGGFTLSPKFEPK